ncbi:MAG TPA: NADH-quinone oxidoreductase subunit NuoE [Syntrophorhabdaceae bacterium]
MLTEEEIRDLRRMLDLTENPGAASVESLTIVQRSRGYISDEAIRDLAAFLAMTPEELDGLATFYPFIFRKPVGRHLILLCDSVTCWALGYDEVRARVKSRLGIGFGETTADGRFTLLPASCMGACDHAPAAMVDGKLYTNLDGEAMEKLLDACVED